MSTRSRILIVDATSRTLPYDYWYVRAIAQHCDVDLLISEHCANNEYLEYLQALPNVKVLFTGMSKSRPVSSFLKYLLCMCWLVLVQRRYAAINVQWSVMPWIDMLVFPLVARRLAITLHNPVPHSYKGKRYLPFVWFSQIAKRLIFVSEFSRREFLRRYQLANPRKVAVLPHGAMPLRPTDEDSCWSRKGTAIPLDGRMHLRFWGRVEAYKGIDFFLKLLKSPEGSSASVRIIGRWDSSLAPLKAALLNTGAEIVDTYVSFADVLAEFESEAVFVLPYKSASQSGVFYNFLFHKVLFVATDVGDIGDFIRRIGHPGLLFDATNPKSFIKAYRYAVEHASAIRADMERLVVNRFSWFYSRRDFSAALAIE